MRHQQTFLLLHLSVIVLGVPLNINPLPIKTCKKLHECVLIGQECARILAVNVSFLNEQKVVEVKAGAGFSSDLLKR